MPNWNEILAEIQRLQVSHVAEAQQAVDSVRRKYLLQLHQHTKRNVIAYYSGWLSKPGIQQAEINDEDKNGFMMAIHKLEDRKKRGLDLILHTPGGDIAATQSIVDYLHQMFGNNIRAIVPQIAMSAGTMIACSCREILMSKHSNLGPIDPHLSGVPAFGVIAEFRRACREVKKDPSKVDIWQPIIAQYRPTFLSRCENGIKWSNEFVEEQLTKVMFENDPDAVSKARLAVRKLTDYSKNKTHNRHIHYDECHDDIGLNVRKIESDATLQDLVLSVHHCYMHSLMNTPAYKMIENHLGTALVKREVSLTPQAQKP
jgi:ATP-dependent protease ClpP protease subunit